MKKAIVLVAACVASSSLAAQGNVCSPPWNESSEGGYYTYAYFGARANTTNQLGTGHVSIGDTLKSLKFRHDNYSYSSYYGDGRTWSNVNLDIGPSDLSTWNSTFSTNFSSTPTTVFSGSVTWDSISGSPASSPATWGGSGLTFAFGTGGTASSYTHVSSDDVNNEFRFAGGVHANGSTSTTMYYRLDAWNGPTSTSYGLGTYIPSSRLNNNTTTGVTTCNDSAHTTNTGSYVYQSISTAGAYYSVINYRNKLRFYTYSYYTAPGALVFHVHAFSNNVTGFNIFNTGCNNMHVSGPLLLEPRITLPAAANSSGYSGYYDWVFPWDNSYSGQTVTTQAAWTDSVSGKLLLSQARATSMPSAPVTGTAVRNFCYSSSSATATTGSYSTYYQSTGFYNPSMCYGK